MFRAVFRHSPAIFRGKIANVPGGKKQGFLGILCRYVAVKLRPQFFKIFNRSLAVGKVTDFGIYIRIEGHNLPIIINKQ